MQQADRHIFVSYSRADMETVTEIIDSLRDVGLDIWVDRDGIKGATFWRKEIVEAITACAVVLFFASKHSCTSDNVSKELALAGEEGKPILPVLIEAVEISPELRFQIAGIQYITWYQDRQLALQQISTALQQFAPLAVAPPNELQTTRYPDRLGSVRRPLRIAAVAGLVVVAVLAVALPLRRLIPLRQASAASGNSLATVAPPASESVPRSEQAPFRLQDSYYIDTLIEASDHKPFIGLRVRFKVLVTQDGKSLDIRGEKIGEVMDGEETILSGRGKTAITLTGHVETPMGAPARVFLSGDQASTSRDNFSTIFELHQSPGDLLSGTFKSTAGNTSGTTVWIPENRWLKTAWQTP